MYESSFLKIAGYRCHYLLQVTNLIGLGILLGLFFILRKSAWKVINTLVPKTDLDRWTHIFFSFSNAIDHVNEKRRSRAEDDGGVIIDPTEAVFEGIQESKDADEPDELLRREENVIGMSNYLFMLYNVVLVICMLTRSGRLLFSKFYGKVGVISWSLFHLI